MSRSRVAAPLILLTLGLIWLLTGTSLSGFTSASITNNTNTAKTSTGSQAFSHTYPTGLACVGSMGTGSVDCPGSILPTTVAAGSSTQVVDSIKNNGTATGVTSSLRIPSCGPVQFANAKGANANPLLLRSGTTPNPAPADGPGTGMGYATFNGNTHDVSIKAKTWTAPSATVTNAIAVWFRVASTYTGGGGLAVLTTNPNAPVATTGDYLGFAMFGGATGPLQGTFESGGSSAGGGTAYRDGKWHFAYLVMTRTRVTLYVDGEAVGTYDNPSYDPNLTNAYWRLGWGNPYMSGDGGAQRFTGALSNFAVFSGASVPAAPTLAQVNTQAGFDTWASSAVEHWRLNDTGNTVYTGAAVDWITGGNACSHVNLAWSATNPSGSVAAKTLTAWATASSIAAPGPGITQSSTLTLSRIASGFDTKVSGLTLLPTVQMTHAVGSGWGQTFTWSTTPASAKVAIS